MDVALLKSKGLKYFSNQKVRQVFLLFSVNIATIPIGLVTSVVLSRYLGPSGYGDYQFLDNIFTFSVLIFIFGFFHAANRALVLNNNKEKAKEYFGAAFVILIGLFLVMSLALTVYSLFDSNLKEKHLNKILLYSVPFGWFYLALNYFETLFQADNRIKLLAVARLLPKVGFLISAALIYWFLMKAPANKLQVAWGLYIFMQAAACCYVLFKIKMSFKGLKNAISEIWQYNKTYGFHVYTGAAFVVGVAQITGVLISYFGVNNSGVGFFSLALSIAAPLQFIPNTIATTNYKEFSLAPSIPRKLTQLTLLLTAICLIALWLVVPPLIIHFYGNKFQPVISLTFFASIGLALYGMADYYNRFLGAHGHGKLLRNTSFIVGSLILIFNLVLIPRFGATGAAITRMVGGGAYFLCMLYYYKKTVNNNRKNIIKEA
jgi:O-antigen/teichoic acid export membrane protein